MNRQRWIAILVILMMSLTMFTACSTGSGTSKDNGQATSNSKASAPVQTEQSSNPVKVDTVEWWSGSGSSKAEMTKLVEQFNNTIGKEKGIKIDYRVYGGDYQKVLDLAIKSGQAPDLFDVQGPVEPYIEAGNLIPFDDLPGSKDLFKQFGGYLNNLSFQYKGKMYSLPYSLTTNGLVYNKDLFKKDGIVDSNGNPKPPITWDEVRKDAKIITDKGAGKEFGIALPMKFGGFWALNVQNMFTSSIGHIYYNTATGKYDFSAFKPALEWMLQLKKDNSYFPGPEGLDNDTARAMFSAGKIGMIAAASYDVGVYNVQFPAQIDWGVVEVPTLDPNVRYNAFENAGRGFNIGVNAKKLDLNKIMDIVKWYWSDQMLTTMYEDGLYIPYKPDIAAKATANSTMKGWKEFAAIAARSTPANWGPDGYLKLEGQNWKDVFTQIWIGKVSVDQGLADLDKRYNDAKDQAAAAGKFDPKLYVDPSYNIARIK